MAKSQQYVSQHITVSENALLRHILVSLVRYGFEHPIHDVMKPLFTGAIYVKL